MRIAGHTYPYRHRPLGDALDELAQLRLSLVEVWLGHTADGPEEASRALRERGLEAAAVSAGGFYTADSDAIPKSIELAQALAAPVIVACVTPQVLGSVVERIPAGTQLCVENHWDQALATTRDVSRVLAAYPAITACLDTGHALLAGEAPDHFVASVGDRMGHVHLKDAVCPPLRERLMGRRLRKRLLPRPEPVMPGFGALDIGRVRRALEGAGYRRTVTIEYEGTEPSVALAALLELWQSSASDRD
jgi:sugar phosphate isomerase/epimerase